MEKKRIYASLQLVSALPANVLKTFLWITGWNTDVKYYAKQFCKALKMSQEEVEKCIQTLIDVQLVDVSKTDGTWILSPNHETNQKYYNIPISKVVEGNGIKMAENATWMQDEAKPQVTDPAEMSESEIKTLILRLQASLNEKAQMKKVVVTNPEPDDLPY